MSFNALLSKETEMKKAAKAKDKETAGPKSTSNENAPGLPDNPKANG